MKDGEFDPFVNKIILISSFIFGYCCCSIPLGVLGLVISHVPEPPKTCHTLSIWTITYSIYILVGPLFALPMVCYPTICTKIYGIIEYVCLTVFSVGLAVWGTYLMYQYSVITNDSCKFSLLWWWSLVILIMGYISVVYAPCNILNMLRYLFLT